MGLSRGDYLLYSCIWMMGFGLAGVFFPEKLAQQFKVPLGKNGKRKHLMGLMFLWGMGFVTVGGIHSIVRRTGNKAVDDTLYLCTVFNCALGFARTYMNLDKNKKFGMDKNGDMLNLAFNFVLGVGAALLWKEGGMQIPKVNMGAFSFDSALDQFNVWSCVIAAYFAVNFSLFPGKGTKDMKLRDYYNDTQIYIRKGIIQLLGSVNIVVAATTIAGVSSGNSAFQYAMCRFNWITSALFALAFSISYLRLEDDGAPKEYVKAVSMYRMLMFASMLVAARAMISVDTA